ncbi:MAG: DUF1059 domain-containing protein, partial [Mesorhizobium sp.]
GKRENPMKEFHCGSLVPGCDWHTRAASALTRKLHTLIDA